MDVGEGVGEDYRKSVGTGFLESGGGMELGVWVCWVVIGGLCGFWYMFVIAFDV